jgi:MoxR-like ATPase
MERVDIELLQQQIQQESAFVQLAKESAAQRIIGQDHMIDRLIIGLLARGHVLLEGLPGLAKTLAIKTLADTMNASFNRIQFTPDLLPADIVGTMIFNPGQQKFTVRQGPVFANFILADEINRAPSKVQSALLEAMQERQVTIGKESYKLEEPFLVLATQNPIEQEGTYPLPEAQTDRFMLKVHVGYPSKEEERQIIRLNLENRHTQEITPSLDKASIVRAREYVDKIYMDEKIEQYIIDLVFASRFPEDHNIPELKNLIEYGGSPRASIYLAKAAKCMAFMSKRAFVIPEDVRAIAKDVLRHRIGITYEAEAEGVSSDDMVETLLSKVEIP